MLTRFLLALPFALAASAPAFAQTTVTIDIRNLIEAGSCTVDTTRLWKPDNSFHQLVFHGQATSSLANGTYTLEQYGGLDYGTITVQDGQVALAGKLAMNAAGAVSLDRGQLTRVTISGQNLTQPVGASETTIRIGAGEGWSGVAVLHNAAAVLYLLDTAHRITDYGATATYGFFDVAAGALAPAAAPNSPGAVIVVAATSTVTFDRNLLCEVAVPVESLTEPAGGMNVDVATLNPNGTPAGGVTRFRGTNRTLFLPDAWYMVSDFTAANVKWGRFTVSGRAVTTTDGAVVKTADGIGFDRNLLAPVFVDQAALSDPAKLMLIYVCSTGAGGLGGLADLRDGGKTLFLTDGDYVIRDVWTVKQYGSLTVAGLTVIDADGHFKATASGGLAVDPCALPRIQLTMPVRGYIDEGVTTFINGGATVTLALVPGDYKVKSDLHVQIATFTIESDFDPIVTSGSPTMSKITCPPENSAPTAALEGTMSGLTGGTFTFDASDSTDPDGDSLTYAWDFGNGSSGAGATASTTYASAGTYTVTVTVSDGILSDAAALSVTVTAPTPAQALDALAASTPPQGPAAAKLTAAQDALRRGNVTAARNQLRALVNSTKDPALAAAAQAIIDALPPK